jgi:hypothetical protein
MRVVKSLSTKPSIDSTLTKIIQLPERIIAELNGNKRIYLKAFRESIDNFLCIVATL